MLRREGRLNFFFLVALQKSLFTAQSSSCLGHPRPFSGAVHVSAADAGYQPAAAWPQIPEAERMCAAPWLCPPHTVICIAPAAGSGFVQIVSDPEACPRFDGRVK